MLGDSRFTKVESVTVIKAGCGFGYWWLSKGRVVEIYGPESSGKTTLALHAVAEAQKWGIVAYIDAENAMDVEYIKH